MFKNLIIKFNLNSHLFEFKWHVHLKHLKNTKFNFKNSFIMNLEQNQTNKNRARVGSETVN